MSKTGSAVNQTEGKRASALEVWIEAARPQTLPAAGAPVLIGAGLAWRRELFSLSALLTALAGAVLIQIATNFANDYYDGIRGVDRPDREGFMRATGSGLVKPTTMWYATWLTFGLVALPGAYLVRLGGLPILTVGVLSIVAAVTYSGGPWPYGYRGLGNPMVFLFFGPVAVAGTYYVQYCATEGMFLPVGLPGGSVPLEAVLAGVPPGCLSTAILVVNNHRDRESDRENGKITLSVLLGTTGARLQYLFLLAAGYAVPVWFYFFTEVGIRVLAPLLSVPSAVVLVYQMWTGSSGEELNRLLSRTGRLHLLYSILFAVGLGIA